MLFAAFNETTGEHVTLSSLELAQEHVFPSEARPVVIGAPDGRAWVRAATPGNPPAWWETTVRSMAVIALRDDDTRRQRTICHILVLVGPAATARFGAPA